MLIIPNRKKRESKLFWYSLSHRFFAAPARQFFSFNLDVNFHGQLKKNKILLSHIMAEQLRDITAILLQLILKL